MTESKPIESDEQIAERLSKRHCWPREQISDLYEYGFQAGYLRALHAEREKVRELVDALKTILSIHKNDLGLSVGPIDELIKKHGG